MRGEPSVARHRRYAGPPSGRRGRRPATSAIRVRITTGSYPLHCSARTPLFLFFVFFSLLIFPSLSRFLVSVTRAAITSHTLCRLYRPPSSLLEKPQKKKKLNKKTETKNYYKFIIIPTTTRRNIKITNEHKLSAKRIYDDDDDDDTRVTRRVTRQRRRLLRCSRRDDRRPVDRPAAVLSTAAAKVFAARRAPVTAPSAITYCYTYPGALHVAAAAEQQPTTLRTCCAHCCSPSAAAAFTTAAAATTAATAAYHHHHQQQQQQQQQHHHVYQAPQQQPLQQYQLAVAVTPQPKTPLVPQHVGLYHLQQAATTYQPQPPPTQQQPHQPPHQYIESITTAPPTATIATPATAAAVQQDDVEMRGSDEMVTSPGVEGGPVSNGDTMGTNHVDNNNDAKKVKLDKTANNKPSRVIHIRNIPNEVTEAEVIHLGIPFGKVTNVLVLKGKNQAFLEMADETSASAMVTYFTTCTAQLRGRAVFIQFSNHKELKTDQTHSNANASAQAALQAAQALAGQSDVQGGPNTVLRVIVEHMVFPIGLDVLYEIFSRYGKVLKIVTFTKNNSFQVLIQYPDVVTAQSAKLSLDGQNIYTSCCKLRIEYSKLSSLNVKYNNDKSRDYTNPTLPNGDNTVMETLAALGVDSVTGNQLLPHQLSLLLSGVPNAAAGLPQAARRQLTTNADHSRLAGSPGMLTPSFNAVHGLASPLATSFANTPVTSMPLGFTLPGGSLTAGTLRLPGQMTGQTCVLLVSNLNEEMVTPDAIFTLFGVYGDVLRVKILYNKKDGALVQMAEPHQAHLAMLHLDKVRLYGKYIRVMQSKYQTVQLPKEGQPDSGLTKDYTSSPLHRFKKPGSKNYQNIYPPSSTLHLSNIPTTLTEDFLKTAFENNGFTVKDFKFFPKDRKMALIQMESLEEAVAALIKMHNYRLSEQNHLRVSFSKSNIQPDTLTPN